MRVPVRPPGSPSARAATIAVGLAVGGIWAAGAALPVGVDLPGLVYVVSDDVYTAMLASYALVAWLATRLAPDRAGVRAFALVLAAAGIAGAVGNFLEDLLYVAGSEYLYGIGFFGSFVGFVGLAAALLVARRVLLGLAVGTTLAGIVIMAAGGPPVVPVVWLGMAARAIAARSLDLQPGVDPGRPGG
jgi:hypothetical protein